MSAARGRPWSSLDFAATMDSSELYREIYPVRRIVDAYAALVPSAHLPRVLRIELTPPRGFVLSGRPVLRQMGVLDGARESEIRDTVARCAAGVAIASRESA